MGDRVGAVHESFAADLSALKQGSNFSYQKLSRELNQPVSTIHGWITGRHLPYRRDNDRFEHLLRLLGADDIPGWSARLARLRTGDDTNFDNPYRGLESFTETDFDLFHGRARLTKLLIDRVDDGLRGTRREPLMVIGASGSGKTSLLRAGLSPGLRAESGCTIHYLTPGNSPTRALVGAVSTTLPSRSSVSHDVVIVDQFEELFTEANADNIDGFIQLLADIRERPRTTVVVGLRSDFFHRAATIPFLLDGLQLNQIVVGPMTTDEVTECIVLPARHSGLTVAPDLLAELITEFGNQVDAGGSSEALPLLSHVLYQLTDTLRGNTLTLDRYREIGGLGSALQRSADTVMDSLGKEREATCRFLFTRLVELGVDSLPTRRTVGVELIDKNAGYHDLGVVIDEFAGHRLLTVDIDTVTISHETLLNAWPRLVGWIEEERDTMLTVRRIKSATRSWDEAGRDPDALLRGSQLDAAISLIESQIAAARLSPTECRFLDDSQAARRERLLERADLLSRQLSAQAVSLRTIDPSLSAQIALIGNQTASTVESRSALLGSTSPLPGARFLAGPGPTTLAVSVDSGRVAFSNSSEGTITILDPVEGLLRRTRILRVVAPRTDIHALALSPDGRMLAAGGSDCIVTLVDLTSGESTECADGSTRLFDDPVRALTFGARGRLLFAAGDESGVPYWSVVASEGTSGAPSADFEGVIPAGGATLGLAVEDTGELLATAGRDGTIALWELRDPSAPRWLDAGVEDGTAAAVTLSADGGTLVAGYHSGGVRVWSVENRSALVEVAIEPAPFASWVNSVEFAPNGHLMVAASSDGNVRMWDTENWRNLHLDLRHPTVVTGARFTEVRSLVTSAEDGTVRVWQIPEAVSSSGSATIWSLGFDSSGRRLASSSRTRAALWSLDKRGNPQVERTILPPGNTPNFSGASCLSPDGEVLALGTRDGDVLILHPDRPELEPVTLRGLTNLVENLDMSSDGSKLCGVDHDGNVEVWMTDTARGMVSAGSAKVAAPAMCPAFGIDSTTLAVASESGDVTLFDVTRPGSMSATAAIDTGESFALSVAFHPTMPVLAVANADRSVSLWDCVDPASPKLVNRLTGPGGKVMTVVFDPAGDRLAAGITDGKVWVWDTSDHRAPTLHALIQSREHGVYSLAFSPDGRHLLGAGPRQRVFSWFVDEHDAAEAICRSVGDLITPGEWSRLVPSLPYRKLCIE